VSDWKRFWVLVLVVVVLCAGYVGGMYVMLLRHSCERWETPLARDDLGHAVASTFENCVFAGDSEWVDLIMPNGHRERVFEFSPVDGIADPRVSEPLDPSASWVAPNVLRIFEFQLARYTTSFSSERTLKASTSCTIFR
jgi:hypothetical protein